MPRPENPWGTGFGWPGGREPARKERRQRGAWDAEFKNLDFVLLCIFSLEKKVSFFF